MRYDFLKTHMKPNPASTRHSTIVGLMLVQRRRRWANIEPTLVECLVSAEMPHSHLGCLQVLVIAHL